MKMTLVLLVAMMISGCASNRKSGFEGGEAKTSMTQEDFKSLEKSIIQGWSKRDEKESLKIVISSLEKIASTQFANQDIYTKLTHAYYLMADAHEENVDTKKALWEKGAMYGEQAMGFNAEFSAAMKKGVKPQDSLDVLGQSEVPAMYWTASNLGKWAKHSGIASQLKYKGYIRALIGRVEKVDAKFFYGAVQRYNGAFYAVAPGFAGGDMKKSIQSFEESLKIAPYYLGTKVLMAELYYSKKSDKENFEKVLNEVLNTKDDVFPDLTPENRIEKRKAKKLLDNIKEIF